MDDRELLELADKAKALTAKLWRVNTRGQTVEWLAEADEILGRIIRAASALPAHPSKSKGDE